MEQDYTSIDLRELLGLLRKNVFSLLASAMWGAALFFAASIFFLPKQYQAAATLVVSTGASQETLTGEQLSTARQLVSTYAVLLTNDSLLGEIIRDYGLEDTVDDLRGRISAQAVDGTQVMRITVRDEDPDMALAMLATMVERAPEILDGALQAGTVEVISAPWVDPSPVEPNYWRNGALGAGLGLLAYLVWLMAHRLAVNTFSNEDDVEQRLQLPVLGVIPAGAQTAEGSREAFSFLRASLRGMPQKDRCRRLVVTSAVPQEGVSTVSEGLARCLAAEGRVLLLDTDLRREPPHGEGVPITGLADILEGSRALAECVQHLPEDGYWRLPAGGPMLDPAELLDSRGMEELLASLQEQFDHVIMDARSVLAVADAAVLGRHADAVLLVVRCKTGADFKQAGRAVSRLETSGSRVAGVVLNGCDAGEMERRNRIARKRGSVKH